MKAWQRNLLLCAIGLGCASGVGFGMAAIVNSHIARENAERDTRREEARQRHETKLAALRPLCEALRTWQRAERERGVQEAFLRYSDSLNKDCEKQHW